MSLLAHRARRRRDGLSERVRAARAAVRHRLWTLIAWAVVLGGLGWVVFFSPVFALDTEAVALDAPAEQVDTAAVMAVVGSQAGTPLPRLGTSALRQELLQIPSVADATVDRRWPDGLRIAVTARVAAAAVPSEAGFEVYGLDGVRIATVAEQPPAIPVVAVPIGDDTPRVLTAVLDVLASMPADLRASLTGAAAETVDSITFTLSDGATVFWGSATENDLKAAVLAALRQVPARVFDVSTPRTPVTS